MVTPSPLPMKKQNNCSKRAHLLRVAFYLLLFVVVGVIPFALGQRADTKQSAVADPRLLGSTPIATLSNRNEPARGTWTLTGSLNTARGFHTATLLPNDMVLVAGGFGVSSDLASAEVYDPASGTWAATGSLNTVREAHTATLLPNGKVLVAAGFDGVAQSSSAELYDPASGTWTATGSLNTARWVHTATLLPNGMALVAGGQGSGFNTIDSAELYDPASGIWTTTGNLNAARYDHTATLLANGMVLVAGGFDNINTLASAELYTPRATPRPRPTPHPRPTPP
jgi:hypothetical protein